MSRELDALVAERVMGEETAIKALMLRSINEEPGSCGCSLEVFEACWADPKWWGHTPSIQERVRTDYIKPYSSSIHHAWLVVERLRGRGWEYEIRDTARDQDGNRLGQGCVLMSREEPFHVGALAPTITEAICLAALKVVGAELA